MTRRFAIVLAGGRGSRLGGASKALMRIHGQPALARVVSALLEAGREGVVVVGPPGEVTKALAGVVDLASSGPGAGDVPGAVSRERVRSVIEPQRFGGPAAAIAAGVAALGLWLADGSGSGTGASADAGDALVDLLACDLVRPTELVATHDEAVAAAGLEERALAAPAPASASASASASVDGIVLVDGEGREQWLASCIRLVALERAVAGALPGGSLRESLGALQLARAATPEGATLDIDTPADAAAVGAIMHLRPGPSCV